MAPKLSGHQNKKKKREELETARKNEEARKATLGELPARKTLGPVPLGDPTAAVAYAADALLCILDEVLKDDHILTEVRWTHVKNLCAAIGMTHSKALMQSRLKKLVESDEPEYDEELEPNPLLSGAPT